MSDTKQLEPGDIDIQELSIVTAAGKKYDISQIFVEFSVYENIFTHSISGVISVADTFNMISLLPIVGEETVLFKYKVAESEDLKSLEMKTYKVSERQIVGDKQMYKIFLTTNESFINSTMSLSKYATGHAESMISQWLQQDLASTKTIEADPSGNLLQVTIPWWSPFKCATWASQKAVSADKSRSADYLFFETMTGYKFKNISNVKSAQAIVGYTNTHTRAIDDEFYKQLGMHLKQIINMSTPLVVDQISRFNNDVYKTVTYAHDVTFKALNIKEFDLSKEWDDTSKMMKHKPFTSALPARVSPNIKVASEAAYSFDDKTYDWQGTITNKRNSALMRLDTMKVEIEVWGINGIEAGKMIELRLGKYTQQDTESEDDYYSGRYLIGAIHHRFAPKQYKMYMQLLKDSIKSDIG